MMKPQAKGIGIGIGLSGFAAAGLAASMIQLPWLQKTAAVAAISLTVSAVIWLLLRQRT
jgi:hypothetical protein